MAKPTSMTVDLPATITVNRDGDLCWPEIEIDLVALFVPIYAAFPYVTLNDAMIHGSKLIVQLSAIGEPYADDPAPCQDGGKDARL